MPEKGGTFEFIMEAVGSSFQNWKSTKEATSSKALTLLTVDKSVCRNPQRKSIDEALLESWH
jgi:hypothetical protein